MAKVNVTYMPGEGDPKQTTWRGKQFYKGQPVTLDDQIAADRALIAAAKDNHAFNVGDEDKAADREASAKQDQQNAAKMEMADITEQAEALKRRQNDEMEEIEARHKSEREAFDAANKDRYANAQKVVSGSSADEAQGQESAAKAAQKEPGQLGSADPSKKDGDKEGRVTPTPIRKMESPTPNTPQEAAPAPVSPPPALGQVNTKGAVGGAAQGQPQT